MSEMQQYQRLYTTFSHHGTLIYAGTLLERAAHLFPEHVALIVGQEHITYRQLYTAACALSVHLVARNIKPRDRVLILYENGVNFYRSYFGAWQTGAIVIPVNTLLHEQEIQHIIDDAAPHAVLISNKLAAKMPALTRATKHFIITEDELETVATAPHRTYQSEKLELDEMSVLLYTSGTTGTPKGVMLSSNNIMNAIIQGAARFNFTTQERIYCALPLFHSFTQSTCVWASTAFGGTVIIVPQVNRTQLLEGLQHKPTIILGVPGLYALFCRLKGVQFDHARYIISGGDALTDKVRMYFELLFGRKICNGYGLTETSPFISVNFDDSVAPTHTVGTPFINVQCQIRDGSPIGVLWIKGPNIMLGYYNAPDATKKVLQDGWLNTGDLAMIGADGKIILYGREKELIVVKGVKIYPQEVENLLMSHPQVMAAAVVGVHDASNEEFPVAYIIWRGEPIPTTSDALRAFCSKHLAPYKIPRTFIIRETLPLTATGKIDKKELVKQYQQSID